MAIGPSDKLIRAIKLHDMHLKSDKPPSMASQKKLQLLLKQHRKDMEKGKY